jgi:preprotein translocase subunit SecY
MEGLAMGIGFGRSGYLTEFNALYVIVLITALTAGSAVLMWIGERITEKGVGNGISIVLTINILSRLPGDLNSLIEQFVAGKKIAPAVLAAVIIAAIIVGLVILVVILQCAERKIPVQYSKKLQGSAAYTGAQSSYIPLKVNTGGVIPVIFAQSIMQTPVIIAALAGKNNQPGFWGGVLRGLSQGNWFNTSAWIYSIGALVYFLLIIAFAYFYTSITFNPLEIADNMKKSGGFIPGIRPGKPTSDYLNNVLGYVIFIGAIGLAIVSMLPIALNGLFKASVSFGGTSIIIIVGVVVETLKQIESQMMVRNYRGFLSE